MCVPSAGCECDARGRGHLRVRLELVENERVVGDKHHVREPLALTAHAPTQPTTRPVDDIREMHRSMPREEREKRERAT